MTSGVFISYRRSDSAGFAGRIADHFARRYPSVPVFFDVTSVQPGEDFVESIQAQLESCAVVLAPIGADWLDARDPVSGQRRIDNPNDFVRRELSIALRLGVRVVPVLLDDAQMPSTSELPEDLERLTRCNAALLRHASFLRDVEHLGASVVGHLETAAAEPGSSPSTYPPASSAMRDGLIGAFETFAREWSPGDWMICEAPSGRFVQFMRESDDAVTLDLPVEQLDLVQLGSARRLILEDHVGQQADDVALQIRLPMEPSYLAHVTLDVFDRVFGARGGLSLTVTLEGPRAGPARLELFDERGRPSDEDVPREVVAELERAFEAFCSTPIDGFMICEMPGGEFVQFARDITGESVTVDLPTEPLNPQQLVAAQQWLEFRSDARRNPTGDGYFSYQLDVPPDPAGLTRTTLGIFEMVFGLRPRAPLAVTTGRW
jgi:hypothetical protein